MDASAQQRTGRRVAITGLGAITPVGRTARETWLALCRGRSGITSERAWLEQEVPGFTKLRTHLAGRVKDYELLADGDFPGFAARLKARDRDRELSRAAILALRASAEALADASLVDARLTARWRDANRAAVVLGSGIGGASALDRVVADLNRDRRPPSTQMYRIQPDNPTVVVKRLFGARGPSLGVSQACASGGIAIALAAMMIERGDADVALAGGAEALEASLVALFEATGAANDAPHAADAVQPFDVRASGAVLAEGAGVVVLESEAHARARSATVLGWVDGYAITGGGGSPSLMEEEGLVAAMLLALERSGLEAHAGVAISPHATGTRAGDRVEARAIRRLTAGEAGAPGPVVESVFPVKGSMGHTIGASGGIEAVVSVLALEARLVPPAATTREPLEDVRALLPGPAEPAPLAAEAVLSNSMGFGDQTVSLVIRRAGSPDARPEHAASSGAVGRLCR